MREGPFECISADDCCYLGSEEIRCEVGRIKAARVKRKIMHKEIPWKIYNKTLQNAPKQVSLYLPETRYMHREERCKENTKVNGRNIE